MQRDQRCRRQCKLHIDISYKGEKSAILNYFPLVVMCYVLVVLSRAPQTSFFSIRTAFDRLINLQINFSLQWNFIENDDGHVEIDPEELFSNVIRVLREAIKGELVLSNECGRAVNSPCLI